VFGLRYAGWYSQLSNVKPTQVSNGSTSKEIMSSMQPLERPTDYYNKGVLAISFTKLRQQHYMPTYVHIYRKK
jgi:lipopolysaccharide biosynthesis glycosyltransferase